MNVCVWLAIFLHIPFSPRPGEFSDEPASDRRRSTGVGRASLFSIALHLASDLLFPGVENSSLLDFSGVQSVYLAIRKQDLKSTS